MIILINGTSSSGKSTLSLELQKQLGDGWLYFSMDDYLSMLGAKFAGLHPDNPEVCTPNAICYAHQHEDGAYEIVTGELCLRLFNTIPDVISLLARQGFHLIIDSLITTFIEHEMFKSKLEQFGILFVYLYAPESVIAQREMQRGDRLKGSALHWLKAFECESACDLSFNTAEISLEEMSRNIIGRI